MYQKIKPNLATRCHYASYPVCFVKYNSYRLTLVLIDIKDYDKLLYYERMFENPQRVYFYKRNFLPAKYNVI